MLNNSVRPYGCSVDCRVCVAQKKRRKNLRRQKEPHSNTRAAKGLAQVINF